MSCYIANQGCSNSQFKFNTHSQGEAESWDEANEEKPVAQQHTHDNGADGEDEVIIWGRPHVILDDHWGSGRWLVHYNHILQKR